MSFNWNSWFNKSGRPKLSFPKSARGRNSFPSASSNTKRLKLPSAWKPSAAMRRVHVHWTAGADVASSLDREHYHLLIEGDGKLIRGHAPITGNIPPLREGKYAAHTRRSNSYAIGVGMCGMHGATDNPLRSGRYPLTQKQWSVMIGAVADLCRHYDIEVTHKTVLTHAEVQTNLGVRQNGKWDVAWLPFWNKKLSEQAVGDKLRAEVQALI